VAQPTFLSILIQKFYRGKQYPKNWATLVILRKTAHRKQPPNGLKFAQSGHPVEGETLVGQTQIA
jgi:hypothetical protein